MFSAKVLCQKSAWSKIVRGKFVVDEVIGMMEGGLIGLIVIFGLDSE